MEGSNSYQMEQINHVAYRYNPDNYKYEGAAILSLDPITKLPNPIAYSTNIKPLIEPDFGESLYFIDNNWIVKDDYLDGNFFNISNGNLENSIKVKEFNNYTENQPNLEIQEGDKIAYINNEWVYTEKSATRILNEEKLKKYRDLNNLYEASQFVHLINGICFSAVLKGEWYNSILEKRKSAARSRKDKLCYIRIPAYYSDDPNKTIKNFEGVLPLSFIEIIDSLWDEISLDNFRTKEHYLELINKAENTESLPNIQFQEIQTIDLNSIADDFVVDLTQSQQDRNFLLSKKKEWQYHLFSEFDNSKSIQQFFTYE